MALLTLLRPHRWPPSTMRRSKMGFFTVIFQFLRSYGKFYGIKSGHCMLLSFLALCGIRFRHKNLGNREFLHLPEAQNGESRTDLVLVALPSPFFSLFRFAPMWLHFARAIDSVGFAYQMWHDAPSGKTLPSRILAFSIKNAEVSCETWKSHTLVCGFRRLWNPNRASQTLKTSSCNS